jgi:PilZ domain
MASHDTKLTKSEISQMRRSPRAYPVVTLPVFDVDDPTIEGLVQDISESGVQISGMDTRIGAKKTFIIQAAESCGIKPFSFDAECKWVRPAEEGEMGIAGFEIISISEKDLEELQKVLQTLVFSD